MQLLRPLPASNTFRIRR